MRTHTRSTSSVPEGHVGYIDLTGFQPAVLPIGMKIVTGRYVCYVLEGCEFGPSDVHEDVWRDQFELPS